MNKKIITGLVAVFVISVSFYAGTNYAGAQRGGNAMRANFTRGAQANLPAGLPAQAGQKGMRAGGGMIGGEVMSKDAQGITVKMGEGGSQIIFLSSGTQITKSVIGTVDDVAVGGQVSITGDQNPDGSVTAKTVQIRKQ